MTIRRFGDRVAQQRKAVKGGISLEFVLTSRFWQ
jgi:hypothetical protein